jgi:hypothetical protein
MEKEQRKNITQADALVKIIKERDNASLFHDEYDDGYVFIKTDKGKEVIKIKSKTFRRWLSKEFWEKYDKTPNSESLKASIEVLEGIACFEGKKYELSNRIARKDKDIWYDLTNEELEAVKINEDGWNIEKINSIIFKRQNHNKEQVRPSEVDKNAGLLFKYVNITDPKQRLLLLVYVISCFIPGYSHPLLVIFGAQGSAKSTLAKFLRRIIDPSLIEVVSMMNNQKELVQALSHHTFIFFDNVSYVSESTSDTLCKAITGAGFIKRELYENDEDVIYKLKKCIGINGINLVSTKPDLLDRSILIELERISESNRMQDSKIEEEFQNDLPKILGGIFDVLSKTIKNKKNIKLQELPRMADFALWGCAIAEALGFTKEEFISAYKENIENQKETVLNDNIIAIAIMSFMNSRNWDKWEGTSSDLLSELTNHISEQTRRDRLWPKGPSVLSRALNTLKTTFEERGVRITNSVTNKSRVITIEKTDKFDESMVFSDDTTVSLHNF